MKSETNPGLANSYHRARKKIIQAVEINDDVFPQIAGFQAAFCRHRLGRDQYLSQWSTFYTRRDTFGRKAKRCHGLEGLAVSHFDK